MDLVQRLLLVTTTFACFGVSTAFAQEESQPVRGYSLLLDLHPAYALSHSSNKDLEGDRSGYFVGGSLVLSAASERMVVDGGLGWFHSYLSGSDPSLNTDNGGTYTVRGVGTDALFASVAPALRIDHFIIGPSAMVLFGQDTTFAPESGSSSANVLVGGRLGYIHRTEEIDLRLTLRYDTSLTLQNRQVHLFGVGVAIGFPFWTQKTKTIVREQKVIEVRQGPSVTEKVPVFMYMLNSELVNFEYDKEVLLPESRIFLSNLGDYLVSKQGGWERLVVEGHTDQRGTEVYNIELSRRRATAVANALIARGVDRSRIEVLALGKNKPLDSSTTNVSMARNRRVELHFVGVQNQAFFNEGLELVRKRSINPSTCKNGVCK